MQKRQGYCTYCRVTYANLEQHLFSAQHRTVTRQSRQRLINNNSLMERFLQDVLQHHPYNYQDSRLAQCEMPTNTTPPEVIRLDEFFPGDAEAEQISSKSSESVEQPSARPGVSQNSTKEVSVRPSVIQKLEKGQQQSLEFNKIESCVRKVNIVGVGQATNSGKSVIRLPVICNAPARCVPGSSQARPVIASTSRAPVAACLESVSKCNSSKDDRYVKELDEVPRNFMPSCQPEVSSGSYENPKESNSKSVCGNLDTLVYQKDAECQGEALSAACKFREPKDMKSSIGVESSPNVAVKSGGKLNKPDVPPAKQISEGAIPKRRGEFLLHEGCTQEEKHLVCNKPGVLKQKCSASATVKLDCGSLQSVSVPARKAVQELHLWKEQDEHEDENCGSRGNEISFNYDFSPSSADLSKVTVREINLSGKIHAPLQYKRNTACDSEISSDDKCGDSLQVVDNQSQVIIKGKNPQEAKRISLVDESYDSSGSEMNSDCDNSAEPTDHNPQQPDIDVTFPAGVPIDLVDGRYGSDSSKERAASVASLESVGEEPPVDVTKKKLQRKPCIYLADKSCKSDYSESSSDSDGFPQSADDHPQMTVTEGNQKGRPVQLKNKKCKPSSARVHLACGVALEAVNHQPQRDVGGVKLLQKENAGLVDMNCESNAPEMGFHADAQLVADESQVAVKELNLQAVDIDLDNKSVQSSISDLSFESHDYLYQSANDELERDLGEVNLTELNVDVEAQSSGCSSSELTFDSDSPLLSVTERSQLDVERLKEDPFNLEEESCESNSSGITFDSDIPTCSVADQPQVAVYEEEPVDLENESDESCVSEITFDSDIPLHSGNEQAEVAVKEVIIQEEEYVPLEKKNANPSGSEINSDSYIPLHSVTNPPEVAIRKLNSQKEQQVQLKHKENEPTDYELNLNYEIFHSSTGHSEELINDRNSQKEEHVHLENKSNKSSVSGPRLDSDIPFLSVIHKPQVVVKNTWLHKEKQGEFQGKSAELSASEVKSNVPHCPVTKPQVSLKRKEKKKHIEKKTDRYGDSELILNSDDIPQSVPKKPRVTVLQEALVHPEGESTHCRGFEAHVDVTGSLSSVPDQSHQILRKENHVNLKDKSNKRSESKVSFYSVDHLQSLVEQHHKVVNRINLSKEEAIILRSEIDVPSCSKATHHSDVPLKSPADQPEVAVKWISQGKEYRIFLENKSKNIYLETNLDSDFLVQAIVDRPNIAVAKSEAEGKCDPSGDSEGNTDSATSVQLVADQPREMMKAAAPGKDKDVDTEGKRGEAEGFEITHDSDVLQPVTGQTKVIQEVKLLKKQLDLEDKNVKPSESKMNVDSNEPPQSVTNRIGEPVKLEANLPVKGHVCFDDKGYQSDNSEIIYISNTPLHSVIQQPQSLQEERASLKMKSSDPRPTTSFDSSEPRQSMRGKLTKTVQETNVKEGHIYLEDKSYKLVGFEASCDSGIPIQFVVDPSHVSAKEINVQKDHNDLENESYTARCSEVKCGTGIQLQSEVDPLQMAWEETSFQNRELFDVEGQANESSDSEMTYDSDVSFQIIVTQPQSSDGEADSPEVVVVNVVAGDCDHEVTSDPEIPLQLVTDPPQLTFQGISDPDIPLRLVTDPPQLTIEGISDPEIPLQLVTDPPQLTIEETSSVNAESADVIKSNCNLCGSHLRRKASSQPVTDHFKETFKIINRENDYIVLGDSTCQSCGCEVDFNSASDQSVTYQSQRPGQEYFHSEDKNCESDGPEGNFSFEGTSQETDTDVSVWKDPKYTGLKDKGWESRGSAVDSGASSKSVIHHTADREKLLMLKHADLAHKSGTSYGSQVDFQGDPSIQADIERPRDVEKKSRPRKRVTFDLKEYHYFPSSSVSVVDSVKNLDEAPEVTEDSDEPVLEVLPFVSPSVSGETRPQKVRGDNIKSNCHVKKFKKDHYRSYSHSNRATRKVSLNEETEPAYLDSNQNTVSVQTLPDSDHVAGGAADTNDISVILDKSCCHCPLAVELLKQNWHLASQSPPLKVNHATQTNKYPLKKRKIIGQEEESPKRKCLQNNRKGNKKAQVVTVDVPTSSAKALEPGQPSSSVCVLSSADKKRKEGKSSRSPRRKQSSCGSQLQSTGKSKQNNLNGPLPKKMAVNPPQNSVLPGSDKSESVDIRRDGSEGSSSAAGTSAPTQNPERKSFITTARYRLRARVGSDEACVFLESIDNVPTCVAFKDSDFQPTPSNHGDAKVSLQPVTNECFENKSKKKVSKRKPTTSIKPRFPRSIFKAVIPQQKTGLTSAQQSVWIGTKANAIIRKYTLKYSVFLRHRYQTRASFFAVNPKKKIPDDIRLKKGRDPGKVLLNSSAPPAYFQEQIRAVAGPSRKQWMLRSSSNVGRKGLYDKTYTYKKKTPILVKAYNLRSSHYIPADGRMTTRLSNKQSN